MYKMTNGNCVIRLADGALIPDDTANTDYAEFLAWVAEGNEPEAADPEPVPDYSLLRLAAYRLESDPLYLEWQYDQTPEAEQAWRDKVAEIKARYPIAE